MPSVLGATDQAETPPVGLVALNERPPSSTTTHRVMDEQETEGRMKPSTWPSSGSIIAVDQAVLAPVGVVASSIPPPATSAAAHRPVVGQETPSHACGLAPVTRVHWEAPPVGLVDQTTSPRLAPPGRPMRRKRRRRTAPRLGRRRP